MAMTIFLALNGLGVVFLLYVLANFWMEGHRPNYNARKYAAEFGERDWSDVAVVTQPISRSARIGTSVIPFQTRSQELGGKPSRVPAAPRAKEILLRRISTR
jgi:hypothetical protein